jgi:hypothetical protein
MWSQINVRSSIRLTGGRQTDFKVSIYECQEIFYKFKFKKIPKKNFSSEKVNKYFLKK